jgi:hypothetical protein
MEVKNIFSLEYRVSTKMLYKNRSMVNNVTSKMVLRYRNACIPVVENTIQVSVTVTRFLCENL